MDPTSENLRGVRVPSDPTSENMGGGGRSGPPVRPLDPRMNMVRPLDPHMNIIVCLFEYQR
jgi:hypothetical protein